ncbi:hypothetical protein DES39_0125 [Orbus hercynius]|uniref:Uncharacterized protein n=1 Tax=Orbus hercynius TaxID=593135 RepID=A0A495RHL6_9GAMM|nr:hypothetical protein [Orbus hercynius]RKS86919.1 hypothetical protein DES39_0125 [Orbus hercynius]
MRVRELDRNHDWTFGRGNANYLSGSDAIAQSIKTKLYALKGDWIFDLNSGIAWFDYLDKNPNAQQLAIDVRTEILKVSGVLEITEFDIKLDPIERHFLIQITYTDKYNDTREVEFNVTNNR